VGSGADSRRTVEARHPGREANSPTVHARSTSALTASWAELVDLPPKPHRACDFLQTYDIWFRPIFAFFIVDVNDRRVVHVAVTRAPTRRWTAQQLRNATPLGQAPKVLLRDHDDKFGPVFDRVANGVGTRVVRTAVQAPLMNSVCERFLGSVRRECLDHLVILSERHLHGVLAEYALSSFNTARPHQGSANAFRFRVNVSRAGSLARPRGAPSSVGYTTTNARRREDGGPRK
jgi:hypothetical protein